MIARLKALKARHGILESRIQREEARSAPDSIRITSMKKIRLQLREEIQKVEALVLRATQSPSLRKGA